MEWWHRIGIVLGRLVGLYGGGVKEEAVGRCDPFRCWGFIWGADARRSGVLLSQAVTVKCACWDMGMLRAVFFLAILS